MNKLDLKNNNRGNGLSCSSFGRIIDWKILVLSFLLIIILLVAFSFYISFKVKEENFSFLSDSKKNEELLNRERLSKVITFFDSKQNRLDDLKAKKPLNIDPSL